MMKSLAFLILILLAKPARADFPPTTPQMLNGYEDWKDLIGGVIGGVVGFGSGHLFLGTYKEAGWKFTLLDSATLAALLGANHNSPPNENHCFARDASLSALIGVRIWETLDAPYTSIMKVTLQPSRDSFRLLAEVRF